MEKMPGSGDTVVHYTISVSAGRQGAVQDKLWQLEQETEGALLSENAPPPNPPFVVQWHLLFKFTPAAVKCNTTRPLSQPADVEPQRHEKKRKFRENASFCVFCVIPPCWLDSTCYRRPDKLGLNAIWFNLNILFTHHSE